MLTSERGPSQSCAPVSVYSLKRSSLFTLSMNSLGDYFLQTAPFKISAKNVH